MGRWASDLDQKWFAHCQLEEEKDKMGADLEFIGMNRCWGCIIILNEIMHSILKLANLHSKETLLSIKQNVMMWEMVQIVFFNLHIRHIVIFVKYKCHFIHLKIFLDVIQMTKRQKVLSNHF